MSCAFPVDHDQRHARQDRTYESTSDKKTTIILYIFKCTHFRFYVFIIFIVPITHLTVALNEYWKSHNIPRKINPLKKRIRDSPSVDSGKTTKMFL